MEVCAGLKAALLIEVKLDLEPLTHFYRAVMLKALQI